MEAKHTPGPWTVMAGDNYEIRSPLLPREYPHRCKEDSTGDFVAYVGNHAPDFGEANANLISSAPEMLAALQGLLDRYVLAIGNEDIECYTARAAIAKALGHNGEVRGASRPAGEASSREAATSTVVLEGKETT